jgi:hypothetical protein
METLFQHRELAGKFKNTDQFTITIDPSIGDLAGCCSLRNGIDRERDLIDLDKCGYGLFRVKDLTGREQCYEPQ